MSEPEKTYVRLKVDDVRNIPDMVEPYLNGSNPHSVAIVAIARLENTYVNEWIEYHRKLGFAHLYIYDNSCGNEDHIDTVLTPDNAKETTVVPAYDKIAF